MSRRHPYHQIVEHYNEDKQNYCPHMPYHEGKPVPARNRHTLVYKGITYAFFTCCNFCAEAIKSDPEKYIREKDGKLHLHHRETGEKMQTLKVVN